MIATPIPAQNEKAQTFFALSGCFAPKRREMRLPPPIPNRFDRALSMKNSTNETEIAATI